MSGTWKTCNRNRCIVLLLWSKAMLFSYVIDEFPAVGPPWRADGLDLLLQVNTHHPPSGLQNPTRTCYADQSTPFNTKRDSSHREQNKLALNVAV